MSATCPLHDMWRPFCPQQYSLPMYISPVQEQPDVCSLRYQELSRLYVVFALVILFIRMLDSLCSGYWSQDP